MSGEVRRVVVPKELRPWVKRCDLDTWVGRRTWNTEPRFKIIDTARTSWTVMGHVDFADDPESIVKVAWIYFAEDEEFVEYVLDECDQDLTDTADWEAVVKAFTWVVLQRYNRELGGDDD